jgi:UTP--glucose-1-phosphate uridylyltransferase
MPCRSAITRGELSDPPPRRRCIGPAAGGGRSVEMKVAKAVITAAGRNQRTLPLQLLIDRDGVEKPLLRILVDEAIGARIEEIAVVVVPGDEASYLAALRGVPGAPGPLGAAEITFVAQREPLGYGHAVFCARDFTAGQPFLHLVGDHLYVSGSTVSCARQLVDVATTEACAVSAVQATRESRLPFFGAVGGKRVPARKDLYVVETVLEKPTPTEAEQSLIVPGLRAGHYLAFFGMHVLTPTAMDILGDLVDRSGGRGGVTLSAALQLLAQRERYLALEERAWRHDVGVRYGIVTAQLALALSGKDRAEVLSLLVELLADRELGATGHTG